MADLSIDQDNLPGVKEVCRDFAVLEDHCLAYSLQEQEIESHLASNVHKSRLIQTDLRVAKRIQEEEDVQAKALTQRHQRAIEQSDVEIAHGIQDQLVRQAMQQRQQEEKDAEVARKLQKQMIKEEKKMSKKIKKLQGSTSVEPYAFSSPSGSPRGSRHCSPEPSRSGYPERTGRGGQGRAGSPMEPHLSRSAFYADGERLRGAAPKKEKPARPPPPQCQDREGEGGRWVGTGQRDVARGSSVAWLEEEKAELEDVRGSEGLVSGFEESSRGGRGTREPQDPWDLQELVSKSSSLLREDRCPPQPPGEPDWMAGSDYSVQNVTQGVKQMGLREQELHDMEVARRLQEEELKASLADSRAAQVAQDEEIARMLMEKEKKKACKSSKKWGRKNPDGEWRAGSEVVKPSSKEDYEHQRSQSLKPARPPPPMHNYENESGSLRAPTRPEPTYRGSLHKH
ncbi:coiled-coil domain-containing protein 50-like isoform X1 [Anguilla anguilla]|uniref:coiled-coil domain-containing protein 50-like isoform X1 n=1 Tax=Anguilla anguilla TaxID=7936 RepID=UPI0015A7EBA0|nr:coiled-coil domain-containing protein 50-like isoform X1 [Anguilla anguilla]